MTWADEAAKRQSEPLWCAEFTDGSTTLRYSDRDIAVVGTGLIEARVSRCSPLVRAIGYTLDRSGPLIELLDTDGDIENAGLNRGGSVTFKSGFASLAYASWQTVATYEVAEKPQRSGFVLQVRCAATDLGVLENLPRIESGDTYFFSTLNTPTSRIGEVLPMRFGSWGNTGGIVECGYLGYDATNGYLVYLASAQTKDASPPKSAYTAFAADDVTQVYIDGVEIPGDAWTAAADTSGNYNLLLVKFTIDNAARLRLIDSSQYSALYVSGMFASDMRTRSGRVVGVEAPGVVETARRLRDAFRHQTPQRKLTCNVDGPYANPVDLFEYILESHGPGLAARDSTSYGTVGTGSNSYMDRYGVKVSTEITGEGYVEDIFNSVCSEIGVEQGHTAAGLHYLSWPLDATRAEAEGGFLAADSLTDLHDFVGEPDFEPALSGDLEPVNTIRYASDVGEEIIRDDDAADSYGQAFDQFRPRFARSSVLARSLAWHRIQRTKTPIHVMTAPLSLEGIGVDLAERFKATVRGGPDLGGWSSKLARSRRQEVDLIGCTSRVVAADDSGLESTASAYMQARSEYLDTTLTSVSATSGNDYITTTESAAANLRPGYFVWHQSSTSGQTLCARILRVILDSGTYYIFINREVGFTGSSLTVYVLASSAGLRRALTSFFLLEESGTPFVDQVGDGDFTASALITAQTAGVYDYGVEFDGGVSYIRSSTIATLPEFSVAMWVYIYQGGGTNIGHLFTQGYAAPYGISLFCTNSAGVYRLKMTRNMNEEVLSGTGPTLPPSQWNFIAAAHSDDTPLMKLWINSGSNNWSNTGSHAAALGFANSYTRVGNYSSAPNFIADHVGYFSNYILTDDDVDWLIANEDWSSGSL